MRKLALALVATAVLLALPSQVEAQLQVGPYAAFHDDADFGVGGFVAFPVPSLHEDVAIVADFGIFFPDRFDYWELNGNVQWSFPSDGGHFTPWVFAGINIANASIDTGIDIIDEIASDTEIGLNLGGGATFGTGPVRPFGGVKLELREGSPFALFGGVSFTVGGDSGDTGGE